MLKEPCRQNTRWFCWIDLVLCSAPSACPAEKDVLFTEKLNILSQTFNFSAKLCISWRQQWRIPGKCETFFFFVCRFLSQMAPQYHSATTVHTFFFSDRLSTWLTFVTVESNCSWKFGMLDKQGHIGEDVAYASWPMSCHTRPTRLIAVQLWTT